MCVPGRPKIMPAEIPDLGTRNETDSTQRENCVLGYADGMPMETIQPHQREELLVRLAKPRRQLWQPPAFVAPHIAPGPVVDPFWWRKSRLRRTLWHETNCRHTTYHLTCAEFEMLEREADGFCEICGADLRATATTPEIDHDHAIGWRAVRGLLCTSCNILLAGVDRGEREPSRAMRYYLDNPWHARVGLEPLTCPPQCGVFAHRAV